MERWPVQTQIAAVEAFIRTGSIKETQQELRRNNEDHHELVPERQHFEVGQTMECHWQHSEL
jgi:hypothetical protein